MRDRFGVDSIQFYDHNFFDREVDMVPLLEVLAKFEHAVVVLRARRRAGESVGELLGAGAKEPAAHGLHRRRVAERLAAARHPQGHELGSDAGGVETCRRHGVIPELSFMLAPPQDPEGETERTFDFIRLIKRVHPATEVMIYIYTPLPSALG